MRAHRYSVAKEIAEDKDTKTGNEILTWRSRGKYMGLSVILTGFEGFARRVSFCTRIT